MGNALSRVRGTLTWLALLVGACSPIAASEQTVPEGGVDSYTDDAGNIAYTRATIHIANLKGSGLTLTLNGAQLLDVPGDGIWRVPFGAPSELVTVAVHQQPTAPRQRCEVTQIDDNVFTVVCDDAEWTVGGTIEGYEGKDLKLALFDDSEQTEAGVPYSLLSVASSGAFTFERPLKDNATYEVRVFAQPTSPRQDCAVVNADGVATGGDVSNVSVTCKTKMYYFTATVTGLVGTGLTIKTEVGVFPVVDKGTTTYTEYPVPDGYRWKFEIATQPEDPEQVCYVENAEGVIDGANGTYGIICGATDNVRVSEIGACPYSSSACWFEIYNVGSEPENLGFYKLRTSAISPTSFVPSRTFTLPKFAIPAYGRVVVQAKTKNAMPDGQGVYHAGDGDVVPWWGSDGFIELLNPAGATADFVRWGANTIEPTLGGIWGGGACPALPRGAGAFGRSLQHIQGGGGTPRFADEFKSRAFATYAGSNDVESDVDTDGDGIPDAAEVEGATFSSLPLYAMGARQNQRDVFVEIDHMAGDDPATLPRKEALDKVVEAFSRRGIAVHFDVGPLLSPSFNPALYNLGGGNEVPFSTVVGLAPADASVANLYDIKAANMAGNRRMVFYYQVFGWSQQQEGGGSSGVGELPGNDSIITLGGFGLAVNSAAQRNVVINYQAASVMHELGHNFGLRHGGADSINRKPNYVSVMNYLYSPLGLPTIGNAEGDRYDFFKRCTLGSVTELTNAPSGEPTRFSIDYSSGGGRNLDENAVQEGYGLGRTGSIPVDYNCNQKTDGASYTRDLNGDSALDVLADNDDWRALDFVFRRTEAGAANGPSLLLSQEHDDVLTDDTQHRTDEPCPVPYVEDLSHR